MCGFARLCMVMNIEITNAARIIGRCEVILNVIGSVSFTALIELDQFCFLSFSDGLPFKSLVLADDENKPDVLLLDRTTSMKNNWAGEFFYEGEDIETDSDELQMTKNTDINISVEEYDIPNLQAED